MARASPRTSIVVELEVGARLRGQASRFTLTSSWMSALRARVDLGWPVRAMMWVALRFKLGRIRKSSSDSPL